MVPPVRAPRFLRRVARSVSRPFRRRPSLPLLAGTAVDAAVLRVMVRGGRVPGTPELARVGEELAAAHGLYRRRGVLEVPGCFHRRPPPLEGPAVAEGRLRSLRYQRLTFDSGYEPGVDDPGRDRWLGYGANRSAHAVVLRHPGPPRPWLVCLHGLGTGSPGLDLPGFRAAGLHRRLGVNLVFPVLPLHGSRRQLGRGRGDFLSYELLDVLHGVAQAVWDTRRVLSWVRAQDAGPVGLYGMSLGAYVAGAVSALEEVDLVVAGIPICDVPELFASHAAPPLRARAEDHGLLSDDARALFRSTSPLALPPRPPTERRWVYAGAGDRMATPAQARRLWDHWDRPELLWYPGGHVSFVWSRSVSAFVRRAVTTAGLAHAR
jgi:hypothetical protein